MIIDDRRRIVIPIYLLLCLKRNLMKMPKLEWYKNPFSVAKAAITYLKELSLGFFLVFSVVNQKQKEASVERRVQKVSLFTKRSFLKVGGIELGRITKEEDGELKTHHRFIRSMYCRTTKLT